MAELKDILRERRNALNLSQDALAKRIGARSRSIVNYEKGERPSARFAWKLGEVLGFNPEEFGYAKIEDESSLNLSPSRDAEKKLLYEIKELQEKRLLETERGLIDFPLAAMDMLTMIEAYAQVIAQYTAHLYPENAGMSPAQLEEKLRADVNKVYTGLKRSLGKKGL